MRRKAAIHLGLFLLLAAGFVCAGSRRTFQLIGSVKQTDGKPFRGSTPVVFLQNALTPFATNTYADSGGEFKFKDLAPGLYTMIIIIPRFGELSRTIEIGQSFADTKGRVYIRTAMEPRPQALRKTVSAVELSIPAAAKTEYRKANTCLERSDAAGAIAHLRKALELAPRFPAALNALGTLAYQARNYAEAERYFRQALEQEPESYAPLVNLGGTLLSAGKWQESLGYNLRAVQARPDDALGQSQLGQSYLAAGQLDAAELALKNAKALDPAHFSFPQLALASIYLQKRNPALAMIEMEEFLRLHPDSDRASAIRKTLQELRGKKP